MAEKTKDTGGLEEMSQTLTTALVQSILNKHGFKKENLRPLSKKKRGELKDLVNGLKKQLNELTKSSEIVEGSELPKRKKSKKTQKKLTGGK